MQPGADSYLTRVQIFHLCFITATVLLQHIDKMWKQKPLKKHIFGSLTLTPCDWPWTQSELLYSVKKIWMKLKCSHNNKSRFFVGRQHTCPPGCLLRSDKWLKVAWCQDDTREDRAVMPADMFAFISSRKSLHKPKLTGDELISCLVCPAIGSCCPLAALCKPGTSHK